MPSLIYRWRTIKDGHACKICEALDGYEWVVPVVQGGVAPEVLEHPIYGIVWDSRGSRSHSHVYHVSGCRCHVELDADIQETLAQARDLLKALEATQTTPTTEEAIEE
jgi:hypothetical protein